MRAADRLLDDDVGGAGLAGSDSGTVFDPQVGLASGPSLVPDDQPHRRLAGLALSSPAAAYVAERYRRNREAAYPVDWDRIIGCNAAYRRRLSRRWGLSGRLLSGRGNDRGLRTERAGWKLVFVPKAWVRHYPRQSLGRFWRQVWSYGATRIRLLRGGVSFNPLSLVPGLWVAGTAALAGLACWFPWARWLLAADLGLYLLLGLVVTLRTVARTRRLGDSWLLAMIPWMHLAYGLGTWAEWCWPGRDFSERRR